MEKLYLVKHLLPLFTLTGWDQILCHLILEFSRLTPLILLTPSFFSWPSFHHYTSSHDVVPLPRSPCPHIHPSQLSRGFYSSRTRAGLPTPSQISSLGKRYQLSPRRGDSHVTCHRSCCPMLWHASQSSSNPVHPQLSHQCQSKSHMAGVSALSSSTAFVISLEKNISPIYGFFFPNLQVDWH